MFLINCLGIDIFFGIEEISFYRDTSFQFKNKTTSFLMTYRIHVYPRSKKFKMEKA